MCSLSLAVFIISPPFDGTVGATKAPARGSMDEAHGVVNGKVRMGGGLLGGWGGHGP